MSTFKSSSIANPQASKSTKMIKQFDVLIIGAGASGLMCAIEAAKRGRSVIVLEKSNKPGKKILMSGGGRCNFTNLYVEPHNFVCANRHFAKSALSRYTQWDFLSLVLEKGIPYHERKHGQLFCDDSAKDILDLLLSHCEKQGVEISLKNAVLMLEPLTPINGVALNEKTKRYCVKADKADYLVNSVVAASGGLSIPTLGGSGIGYELAEQFGIALKPRSAGLVPFTFSDDTVKPLCERLSGIAIHAGIQVVDAHTQEATSFYENLLFTHRGMSGPVALQASNYWQQGREIEIDLLPTIDATQLLLEAKTSSPKQLIKTVLANVSVDNGYETMNFPKALIAELESLYWPDEAKLNLSDIKDVRLAQIGQLLNAWQIKPAGTEGYRTAEVTLGGVDSDELSSKTFEAKKAQGLYFIGEVVDVTGHLGGFNFQWAWASGYAAGQCV